MHGHEAACFHADPMPLKRGELKLVLFFQHAPVSDGMNGPGAAWRLMGQVNVLAFLAGSANAHELIEV